jgi:Flp pilus assembly protein TadG
MTVSNRFSFRVARRGFRGMLVRAGHEEGSSLVEFGLVVPLLSMLLLGIIYGGITFYDYATLANAVAIGAKTVASNRGAANACTLGEAALAKAAYNLNQNLLTIDTGASGSETFITTSGTPGTSSCTNLTYTEAVTMTATYPCSLTIPFANINLCPVPQGTITETLPTGVGSNTVNVTIGKCLYAECISSTTTVRIE